MRPSRLAVLFLALALPGCASWRYDHYRVPSPAMEPTLLVGDRIRADPHAYEDGRTPEPGDVIVFAWPKDRSKLFVKRVIAVSGQAVEIKGQRLYVDGRGIDESYAVFGSLPTDDPRRDFGPYTVPPEHVFVLGDNRDQSYDSRFWGPLPLGDVKGKVVEVYFSRGEGGVRWKRLGAPVE
jgi:signal peptidase I